jgi:hypothetical protein
MTNTTQEPQMGLTFEKVWAALMETSEKVNKTDGIDTEISAR